MQTEAQQPQTKVFDLGLEFLQANHAADNWFLQLETFDLHEPFSVMERYKALYPHAYDGPQFDWPNYLPVTEEAQAMEHLRATYAALVSMCDHSLGRVLDFMDAHDMWRDTLLIVNTDHGFLLGEHSGGPRRRRPCMRRCPTRRFSSGIRAAACGANAAPPWCRPSTWRPPFLTIFTFSRLRTCRAAPSLQRLPGIRPYMRPRSLGSLAARSV